MAGLCTATLAIAACGSSGAGSTRAAGGTVQRGGTLTYANYTDIDCLDPQVAQSSFSAIVMGNVYQSLVTETRAGGFRPWLARRWAISDGGRTYTFWLRRGVRFTDGTPFTASTVKANLDRIVRPSTDSLYAAGLLASYTGTAVLGPDKVAVHFRAPYAPFLSYAATPYLGMHSARSLTQAGTKSLCSGAPGTAVGTGPFELSSYTRGQQIVLTRNPRYAPPAPAGHTGPAYLDRIVFKVMTADSVRAGEVSGGQVDAADELPATSLDRLAENASVRVDKVRLPGLGYTYFLNTDNGVLADPRVRMAIRSAFDVATTVRTVYDGQFGRAWGPLGPGTIGYDSSLAGSYRYDPSAAAALLDRAGWTGKDSAAYRTKNGRRLSLKLLYVPQYTSAEVSETDQALQADLKKVGVDLQLIPMTSASYSPVRDAGRYAIIGYRWPGSDPDVLRILYGGHEQFTAGGDNGSRLRDRAVDGWLGRALATTDRARRATLYERVQRRLLTDVDTLPVVDPVDAIALRTSVHGLSFDVNGWPQFYGAWVGG